MHWNWAPDAAVWHKLWSVRLSIFWAVMSGLWMALPAFQEYMTPVEFAGACVGMSVLILVARLTDQKGLNV